MASTRAEKSQRLWCLAALKSSGVAAIGLAKRGSSFLCSFEVYEPVSHATRVAVRPPARGSPVQVSDCLQFHADAIAGRTNTAAYGFAEAWPTSKCQSVAAAILVYFMGICANPAVQKWAEHRAGLPEIDPFLTNLCSTKRGSHISQMTKRFELLSVGLTGSNTFRFNSVRNSRFSLSLTLSGLPPHRLCGEYSRGKVPKVVANSRVSCSGKAK